MAKTIIILISISFILHNSYAQNHDYIWMMGYKSSSTNPDLGGITIDFNGNTPSIYQEDREMNINATFSSFSDSTGNIFAYTDGTYIANAVDELMENGDSINPGPIAYELTGGGYTLPQSAFYLLAPNHPNLVYLFHLKIDYHQTLGLQISTLYYTLIDREANNGLGKVVVKNQELLNDEFLGTLSAVKHANGRDWWIICSENLKNKYFTLLLTPDDIVPVFNQEMLPEIDEWTNGTIVISPDGTKLIRYEVPLLDRVYIYDFDRCTGELSDNISFSVPNLTSGSGTSISPNSQYLYITSREHIYQFDLWADDIEASKEVVAIYDGYQSPIASTFFLSQLGPDGRIYANCTNGENVLHAIQYPNKAGEACEVRQHSVQLPTYNAFTMPHFPNYRLGALDGSPCDTLGIDNDPLAGFRYESDSLNNFLVEFTDNSFYEPTDWLWDFDDNGATSTEVNPLHEFLENGIYNVCLTVSNQYSSDVFCREVELILDDATNIAVPNFEISIYPNPIQKEFTVFSSEYLKKDSDMIFYNQLGQEMAKFSLEKGEQVHNFSLEGVANGIYFYSVFQKEQLIGNGKIVVGRE
ncbi:MAG: hypothetical protein ACI9LN_001420 [Saprospiraceae bacterium]|jgi:hypothetical protein